MFADPFCDTPWAHTSRRGWTTLISFAAQILGVGVLLLLPLIYNEGLPALRALATPVSAPLPLGQPDPVQQQAGTMRPTNAARSEALQVPTSRPHPITDIVDVGPAPTLGESVEIASSSSRRGIADGVVNSILATSMPLRRPQRPSPLLIRRASRA